MENKNRKLPPCHVEYHYGREMHTRKINNYDDEIWKYHCCKESSLEDNVLYKVWLTTYHAADPADQSTQTNVYYFEEVPDDILEMKKKVDCYWKSEEPL
jgi:hypothetical protein